MSGILFAYIDNLEYKNATTLALQTEAHSSKKILIIIDPAMPKYT